MSAEDDRKRHERAKEAGRSCRRNGGKREQNPYKGASLTSERDSWFLGFDEAAAQMKVRR
jgi:ribosome modulation factor